MAFLGLLDYMTGETWLLVWRDHPFSGRRSGTFVNPDHFAAWLAMLVALGLGWLVARSQDRRRTVSLREWLSVRELREAQAPRDVEVRLALARGLERIGQAGDAYREYREVLQLQPAQPDADRAVARLEGRRR